MLFEKNRINYFRPVTDIKVTGRFLRSKGCFLNNEFVQGHDLKHDQFHMHLRHGRIISRCVFYVGDIKVQGLGSDEG